MKPRFAGILFATDLSELSWQALDWAHAVATRMDVPLHVLSVIEEPVYLSHLDLDPSAIELLRETEPIVRDRIAAHLAKKAIQAEVHVAHSHEPAAAIVDQAGKLDVDLLVLGTHGRTGLAHLLLGSVAEKVLRMAPIPVTTVRVTEPT